MEQDKLKEAIASIMKDGNKQALAELIVEYLQPGHITTDFISLLLDTRMLKPGDALVKKVRKGLKVHTLVPGQIPLSHEITVDERMNYILDGSIVSVTANEWELASGQLGTVESIKNEMAAKLRDYHMGKVFTALTSIWTAVNTPDNYVSVGNVVNQTVLDAAIDHINDTTNGVKAIVGTRKALTPIMKFSSWTNDGTNFAASQERITKLLNEGWLGSYLGCPLVVIRQDYDHPISHKKLIPEDKILVIGDKVGEFITYGDVKNQEYVDKRVVPPQWIFHIYQQYGMIIDNAEGIYVIDDLG
jgi:hypothetical protein